MATLARVVRTGVAVSALATACLVAPNASAQSTGPYSTTITIAGITTPYTLLGFSWGTPSTAKPKGVAPDLTFTVTTDSTSASLMQAANAKQAASTAELQVVIAGTTTVVDILMTNVHFESVEISNAADPSSVQPNASVVLHFEKVDYTYQPVTPTGQKAGPPVSFSVTF